MKMKESFSIPITEYKTLDVGKNTIRIRGTALRGDVVSKNQRKYLASELAKACNTWIGKPLTINHNDNRKVGHLTWVDYNNDLLTFEAEVTRQPYVDMIREHSTDIKGFSIQADYLFNKCPKCGKKFYSEEQFRTHMIEEEFIKDISAIPHGMIGTALSMVLSPEVPGFDGTSYEIMEMANREILRLSETITKEYIEMENFMTKLHNAGVAISKTKTVTPRILENDLTDQADTPNEPLQPDPQVENHECPEGQHWDDAAGACVADQTADSTADVSVDNATTHPGATEQTECEDGYHWDEESQSCVPDEEACEEEEPEDEKEDEQEEPEEDKKAEEMDAEDGAEGAQPHGCDAGFHWDEEVQACVADSITQPTPQISVEILKPEGNLKTLEWHKPERLKLGESFGGYDNFEACVAANSDKENPEAHCGHIKQQTEETRFLIAKLDELKTQVNKITEEINKPITYKPQADDVSWKQQVQEAINKVHAVAEKLNKLPKDDKSWKQQISEIKQQLSKSEKSHQQQIKEMKRQLKEASKTQKRAITENKHRIVKETSHLNYKLKTLPKPQKFTDDLSWKTQLQELSAKIEDTTGLKEMIEDMKQKHESLIDAADKSIKEHYEENLKIQKEKDMKIEELTEKLDRTEKLAETLAENASEKLKGEFKGASNPNIKETTVQYASDPLKEKK